MSRTILGPESETSSEINDFLRIVPQRRKKELPLEDIVYVELVLEALAHLLNVIIGQTVSIFEESLVPPVSGRERKSQQLDHLALLVLVAMTRLRRGKR